MDRKPPVSGMLLDINAMRSHANKLLEHNTSYASLLKSITKTDYFYDEDIRIPSLKFFAADAGISYSTARKHLQKIYDDLCLCELEDDIPFEFDSLEILISITGYFGHKTFKVKSLPIIPRKGEMIEIPYFKNHTGAYNYYVENIYHTFKDGSQQIKLYLKNGYYSEYWNLRKSQAKETREISWEDSYMKDDYDLRQMLDIRPGKAW